jgi:hypothetical protein
MLDGLFVAPAVAAITEALGTVDGTIAVIGDAKLAQALAAKHTVIAVAMSARAAKKLPKPLAATAVDSVAAIDPASLAAVIGVDITDDETWSDTLRTWTRATRDNGIVVLVDKGHAAEASRRALCAGLTELEQRHAGRAVVTSGLVTHLG